MTALIAFPWAPKNIGIVPLLYLLYTLYINRDIFYDTSLKGEIVRILRKNPNARAIILCDSSQAPDRDTDYPKEFKEKDKRLKLSEVIRSTACLTLASVPFQLYNQRETSNLHHKILEQGIRPGVRLINNSDDEEDVFRRYSNESFDEIKKIMGFFPSEEPAAFHNTLAIIVKNEEDRQKLLDTGLNKLLYDEGFDAVTALEATRRVSRDPPSGRNGHVIVDTPSAMNGLQRLFIIIVDMDEPVQCIDRDKYTVKEWERRQENDHKNASEIYCACTRGMLYVAFVNKYIENGWMSFFKFTESLPSTLADDQPDIIPLKVSPEDNDSDQEKQNQGSSHSDVKEEETTTSNDPQHHSHITKGPSHAPSPALKSKGAELFENRKKEISVDVANDVCQGKSIDLFSYTSSDIEVMAHTKIYDISKINLDSAKDTDPIPTFLHLLTSSGSVLSENDPFIYKGGKAPKVPFIVISPGIDEI